MYTSAKGCANALHPVHSSAAPARCCDKHTKPRDHARGIGLGLTVSTHSILRDPNRIPPAQRAPPRTSCHHEPEQAAAGRRPSPAHRTAPTRRPARPASGAPRAGGATAHGHPPPQPPDLRRFDRTGPAPGRLSGRRAATGRSRCCIAAHTASRGTKGTSGTSGSTISSTSGTATQGSRPGARHRTGCAAGQRAFGFESRIESRTGCPIG